jgi:hypothetical protein
VFCVTSLIGNGGSSKGSGLVCYQLFIVMFNFLSIFFFNEVRRVLLSTNYSAAKCFQFRK